jgi:hypothetical protein
LFSSNYKDTERSVISTTIIPKDQWVREIKAELFAKGAITYNNECI